MDMGRFDWDYIKEGTYLPKVPTYGMINDES